MTELTLFGDEGGAHAPSTTAPVLAFAARDNATLMSDCARLGYLDGSVLDLTVGPEAGFWRRWRPPGLVTNDIDPDVAADHHHDARALPFGDRSFDTVVFDPPYKLNGTGGSHESDARYGVATGYVPARERIALLLDGTTEALRLARRFVLVKCQDQISSSKYHPQTFLVWERAMSLGAELVDMLHVPGLREQPAGTSQRHSRRNYSTLLVLRRSR